MQAGLQHADTMIGEARRATPDHHIAILQAVPFDRVAAIDAAELEDSWQAQRYRDDGRGEILFVAILMQRQFTAGLIAIDEAGIGREAGIACGGGGGIGEMPEDARHRRPGGLGFGIMRGIAIALPVGHPAEGAATGHRHRHLVAAGCHHLPERSLRFNIADAGDQIGCAFGREAAQDDSARGDHFHGRCR